MAISTTCIGAYPKPDYVPMRDWFQVERGLTETAGDVTRLANRLQETEDPEIEALYSNATESAIADQVACGVDIPTDGEQRRENYIHYHCRHLTGFDFEALTSRTLRDGVMADLEQHDAEGLRRQAEHEQGVGKGHGDGGRGDDDHTRLLTGAALSIVPGGKPH